MDRRLFLKLSAALAASPALGADMSSLAAFLDDQIKDADFSGTILVDRGGETVLARGIGLADRSFGIPCGLDTAYRIASITKLMTATLVLQLAEAGKLDLGRTISAYLPDYRGPAALQVTIRQLLNHTSGIENFDKGLTSYADAAAKGMPAYQNPHSPPELMDLYASGRVTHPPGSAFDYNNADYVILGQIIEGVEKQPYAAVLSRRILEPVGLRATGLPDGARIVPRLAPTYYKDGDTPLAADMPVYWRNWYAAGGLYSTAGDVLAFSKALYGGRLISPASLAALLTPGLEEYGYGLWISTLKIDEKEHRFAQRPGRIMGANALLLRMLDDDATIVILANSNVVDTDRLGFRLARRLLSVKPA